MKFYQWVLFPRNIRVIYNTDNTERVFAWLWEAVRWSNYYIGISTARFNNVSYEWYELAETELNNIQKSNKNVSAVSLNAACIELYKGPYWVAYLWQMVARWSMHFFYKQYYSIQIVHLHIGYGI